MRFSLALVLVALGVGVVPTYAGDCQTVVTPAITQSYAQPAFTQAITGSCYQPQAVVAPQVQTYVQPVYVQHQIVQRVVAQPVYQQQVIQRVVVQHQVYAQPVIQQQVVQRQVIQRVAVQRNQFAGSGVVGILGAGFRTVGNVVGAVIGGR